MNSLRGREQGRQLGQIREVSRWSGVAVSEAGKTQQWSEPEHRGNAK